MSKQAHVTQIDAIKHFRAVLIQYQAALRDGCELLTHESNRGVDWVETDRAGYWPAEVRRLEEQLVAAKNALEQCNLRAVGDDRPSCIDEKKRVVRVKARLERARKKVNQTRQWKSRIHRDGDEFQTRIVQVIDHADTELPRAIAALERMVIALDKYAARGDAPPPASRSSGVAVAAPGSGNAEGAGDSA